MGSIKDIANQSKIQTFPNSQFMIEGEPPASQCSEAKIEDVDGTTVIFPSFRLVHPGKFTGFNLIGKTAHILVNPGGNIGDFLITNNTNDHCILFSSPGIGGPTEYYISNGGSMILTRDVASFAAFIDTAGYSYTIKGGKLYTNIPSATLQPACSILFAPLT